MRRRRGDNSAGWPGGGTRRWGSTSRQPVLREHVVPEGPARARNRRLGHRLRHRPVLLGLHDLPHDPALAVGDTVQHRVVPPVGGVLCPPLRARGLRGPGLRTHAGRGVHRRQHGLCSDLTGGGASACPALRGATRAGSGAAARAGRRRICLLIAVRRHTPWLAWPGASSEASSISTSSISMPSPSSFRVRHARPARAPRLARGWWRAGPGGVEAAGALPPRPARGLGVLAAASSLPSSCAWAGSALAPSSKLTFRLRLARGAGAVAGVDGALGDDAELPCLPGGRALGWPAGTNRGRGSRTRVPIAIGVRVRQSGAQGCQGSWSARCAVAKARGPGADRGSRAVLTAVATHLSATRAGPLAAHLPPAAGAECVARWAGFR